MRAIIADERRQFDWVIVDTPPVGLISDASLLASLVDGVLLVIGAGSTPYAAVKKAVEGFGADRIVGTILNRVCAESSPTKYYDRYYGGNRYGGKDTAR
jgi:Mrp family chromosome partitioning ATPase